jgi:hypothetical protein
MGFVLGTVILSAWETKASHETRSYACAARIVCDDTSTGNTQTLPGDEDTIVRSDSLEKARETCGTLRSSSYKNLERVTPEGCKVASEAFQISEQRAPASNLTSERR